MTPRRQSVVHHANHWIVQHDHTRDVADNLPMTNLSSGHKMPLVGMAVGNMPHEAIFDAVASALQSDKKIRLIAHRSSTAYASQNEGHEVLSRNPTAQLCRIGGDTSPCSDQNVPKDCQNMPGIHEVTVLSKKKKCFVRWDHSLINKLIYFILQSTEQRGLHIAHLDVFFTNEKSNVWMKFIRRIAVSLFCQQGRNHWICQQH